MGGRVVVLGGKGVVGEQGWNSSMVDIAFMNPALCSARGCMLTNVPFPESRNIFVQCPGAGSRVQAGSACF